MNLDALHRTSLRRMLIVVLLAGVFVGGLLQVYVTWRTAEAAVNAAFDRSLYGAIRAIDANVSTDSGGIGVELFHKIVASAGLDAGVDGAILQRLGGACDHPMTINFPEGEYLKGLALVKRPVN